MSSHACTQKARKTDNQNDSSSRRCCLCVAFIGIIEPCDRVLGDERIKSCFLVKGHDVVSSFVSDVFMLDLTHHAPCTIRDTHYTRHIVHDNTFFVFMLSRAAIGECFTHPQKNE